MPTDWLREQFGLDESVAIVTGGGGALGSAMAYGLAQASARVALVGRTKDRLDRAVERIGAASGDAMALVADVHEPAQLAIVRDTLLDRWGRIDILINAAGGNVPGATLPPGHVIFDLSIDALREVIDLNLLGTILPSQVFGRVMADAGAGSIINISSMTATRAISRVVGYSAAKAAIENFTRWLAVDLARTYGERLRVNAVAPGFFIGDQNRALLLNENGQLTERGAQIIAHTPAGRFGTAEELAGTIVWLCSPAARFVTGAVIPIDGGFGIASGV
jgi:NAD(P)-dependent dehydrogenase (short-subunit alcohol dehydrogenase family)